MCEQIQHDAQATVKGVKINALFTFPLLSPSESIHWDERKLSAEPPVTPPSDVTPSSISIKPTQIQSVWENKNTKGII